MNRVKCLFPLLFVMVLSSTEVFCLLVVAARRVLHIISGAKQQQYMSGLMNLQNSQAEL